MRWYIQVESTDGCVSYYLEQLQREGAEIVQVAICGNRIVIIYKK